MHTLITCTAMAGTAEWVCCPGAATAPLCRSLSLCPVVHRWAVSDAATAAFFALGRVQATARPVAVVAGSVSDAAAMLPAVTAAYYQRRPLLVLSFGEAADGGGTGTPGAEEAEGLFGAFAPTTVLQLPCAVSELPPLSEMLADGFPLHVHVRSAGEDEARGELSLLEVAEAPAPPPFRGSLVALSQMLRFRAAEGLVLMLGALEPGEQEAVLWLAQTLRVPVMADATSGLREELAPYLLHGGDKLLRRCPPRYVLRLGEVPAHPFWRTLEQLPGTEVFSVTRTGFAGLKRRSTVIEGDPEQVMKALGDVPHVGDTERLLPAARREAARVEEALLAEPESAAALVRAFSGYAAGADVICLGSPTVRDLWNNCAQLRVPTLYVRDVAERGSEGALAAFLGNAADAGFACCLIGDLALLRSALGLSELLHELPAGRRIIAVLNNGGAGAAQDCCEPGSECERLLVQPPRLQPADVARLWGAEYVLVQSEGDLDLLDGMGQAPLVLVELRPLS